MYVRLFKIYLEFFRKGRDKYSLIERYSLEEIVNFYLGGFWVVSFYSDCESLKRSVIIERVFNKCTFLVG